MNSENREDNNKRRSEKPKRGAAPKKNEKRVAPSRRKKPTEGTKSAAPAKGRSAGADKKSPKSSTAPRESTERKGPNPRPQPARKPFGYRGKSANITPTDGSMRLNKYLSNSGVASRREADELIKTGLVEVNGKSITEMGYKVMPGDEVRYAGEKLTPEKPVYVLLNKPKEYSVVPKDSFDKRTISRLLRGIGNFSVYPVGKMDRITSGLLLLTNDGALSTKLAHPANKVRKIYHVQLDKNLKKEHLEAIKSGVELEDGYLKVDEVSYVTDLKDKKQVGIEIHSTKANVVRRLFETLGYKILKLDRVVFAGLTKKDLPRGKWRLLSQQELNTLKMLK